MHHSNTCVRALWPFLHLFLLFLLSLHHHLASSISSSLSFQTRLLYFLFSFVTFFSMKNTNHNLIHIIPIHGSSICSSIFCLTFDLVLSLSYLTFDHIFFFYFLLLIERNQSIQMRNRVASPSMLLHFYLISLVVNRCWRENRYTTVCEYSKNKTKTQQIFFFETWIN